MRARTTDDLLTDVRARTASPTTNDLLSPAELLQLIDEEMRTELARDIVALRSEYWLEEETSAIVAGQSEYRIPDRALGMTLRDVTIYDVNGNEWNVAQVGAADRYVYSGATGTASAFTLNNGKVVLLPEPATSGYTLRLRYYAQPARLALVSDCAAITSALVGTFVKINVATTPSASLTTVGALVDIVRGAGMFESIYTDQAVTAWVSPDLTISPGYTVGDISTPATNARVDYVCPSGRTVYPPIPESVWGVLVALGCKAYCEAVGDERGLNAASIAYERKRKAALEVMLPRVDGETRRVTPKHTPLRGAPRRSFGWGR